MKIIRRRLNLLQIKCINPDLHKKTEEYKKNQVSCLVYAGGNLHIYICRDNLREEEWEEKLGIIFSGMDKLVVYKSRTCEANGGCALFLYAKMP